MAVVVKTRIVKIGNSQGIRIPKLLLEQADFGDEVELELQDDLLVVRPAQKPRHDWEQAFKVMAERGDDYLVDGEPPSSTDWEEDGWEW